MGGTGNGAGGVGRHAPTIVNNKTPLASRRQRAKLGTSATDPNGIVMAPLGPAQAPSLVVQNEFRAVEQSP